MKLYFIPLAGLLALLTGPSTLAQSGQAQVEPVYSVAKYDPARDPARDLANTINQASKTGKRILLEVGGDWCGWCHALEKFIHQDQAVAQALHHNYIIMKVNVSEENQNEAFFSAYPKIPGAPHIFVLDSDGKLLHSQNTGDLEKGKSYDSKKVLDFLRKWAPEGPRS